MDAVAITGLDHFFGEGEARRQVLFDIGLAIPAGQFVILEGASGSGKTTLLTLLGCLRQVQQGSVRLLGEELRGAGEGAMVGLRRRLGFIFQAHNLHESLTALQNVRMGLDVHGLREGADAAAEAALVAQGLAERLHYLPAHLSGGQKQRVAAARALAAKPELVLADEPTAALDWDSAKRLIGVLRGLRATILMVTHDARIHSLADRVLTMEDGRLVRDVPAG